jgi:hypothetical protein
MIRKDIEEIVLEEGYTLYNEESTEFPNDGETVLVIYEDGSTGENLFWNILEGFDAQTEPHHIAVIAWKRPIINKIPRELLFGE